MAWTVWLRRRGPEVVLAFLACATFLGCLGSVDLWGKREQRASAEALDTVDEGNWLVARIQGRKRLEKPPLPRWTVAALIEITGRRDEWVVRLPVALSALGAIALVYGLGSRIGGRQVGLASGLALASMAFFIGEMRQAGNDGPLALFTTLALYAAWRRLHGDGFEEGDPATPAPMDRPGSKGWARLMYLALGLGFLTKGPIVLLLVGLTVVPYLAAARRFKSGCRALLDGWGVALFILLALSWPVPVVLRDPAAARVWYLEMAQKAGTAGIHHHRAREFLAMEFPSMTAPWTLLIVSALLAPLLPGRKGARAAGAFAWWWTAANLAMFCLWKVAKPNYYLPCLPGAALLAGVEWVRLTRGARRAGANGPRRFLQAHWAVLLIAALAAPVVAGRMMPEYADWAAGMAAVMAAGVALSVVAWRRGADSGALAPLVAAMAVCVVAGYGFAARPYIAKHSQHALAEKIDKLLPSDVKEVAFFQDLDEGLWFYLKGRSLQAVPGSQAEYNAGFALVQEVMENRIIWDVSKRRENEKKILISWFLSPDRATDYCLMRAKDYELFAKDLDAVAAPLPLEWGLKRNEIVLLRARPRGELASRVVDGRRR